MVMDRPLEALPQLLVVDDQPVNIQTLYQIFSRDHQVFKALGGQQALDFCLTRIPDLILLDVMMPDMDGHEVCRRLKRDARTRDIPIIFVTAQDDPDEEAAGLHLGAVDFITKPVNAAVVRARVNTHLRLRRLERELQDLAFYDALTKLPNRRLLLDRIDHALSTSKRKNSHGAVMFLDLNEFKYINDTYGHDVGDYVLIETARRLCQSVRACDTVARLGGDEFVILLEDLGPDPGLALEHAKGVSDKIHLVMKEDFVSGDIRHRGSASIGINLFYGGQGDSKEILKRADAAMYEAKRLSPR